MWTNLADVLLAHLWHERLELGSASAPLLLPPCALHLPLLLGGVPALVVGVVVVHPGQFQLASWLAPGALAAGAALLGQPAPEAAPALPRVLLAAVALDGEGAAPGVDGAPRARVRGPVLALLANTVSAAQALGLAELARLALKLAQMNVILHREN